MMPAEGFSVVGACRAALTVAFMLCAPHAFAQNPGNAPVCFSQKGAVIPCVVDLAYFGGPVIPNVKVYAVFWSAGVSAEITTGIGPFYRTVTNSEFVDWLTEYSTNIPAQAGSHIGQPGTQQIIGRGTFAGNYPLLVLSQAYPPCASSPADFCITEADIQNEIDFQIRQGSLPTPDAYSLYMVHFPPNAMITGPNGVKCQDYCAYHTSFSAVYESGKRNVLYAVIPDVSSNDCEPCRTIFSPLDPFEITGLAASHEMAESITDGVCPNYISDCTDSTPPDYPQGWWNTNSTSEIEIGDLCQFAPSGRAVSDTVGANGLTGCSGGADAGCYTVQLLFSNAAWNANPASQPNVPACVSHRFDADDYSIALSPNTLVVARGTTAAPIPVITTLTNGSPQPLTLSVTDVPPGLSASLDNTSLSVGGLANLTVSADANATPFQGGVVVVRATGTVTHSASLLVQLDIAANDWSLSLSPANAALLPGTSQVYTVAGQVTVGAPEPVSLSPSVQGLPPGVTASFNTLVVTPGVTTSQLTLSASATAPVAAPAFLTVAGVSTSQTSGHTATAEIQVDTPPSVSILSPTAGATVSGVVAVVVEATPGANASIASISMTIDDGPPVAQGTANATNWATRTVSNGSHSIKVTVLDNDSVSASASESVTVNNASSSGGGCASTGHGDLAPELALLLCAVILARRTGDGPT